MSELPVSRDTIRQIFSSYGFNNVDGTTDIDPDAYKIAEELFKAAQIESSQKEAGDGEAECIACHGTRKLTLRGLSGAIAHEYPCSLCSKPKPAVE